MADASLDDFFAKKDKSKKKSKAKLISSLAPDASGSTQEDTSKKKKKKSKSVKEKSDEPQSSENSNKRIFEGDDEWVDFEQETEVDYSGLKIQSLQIINKEDDDQDENQSEEEVGEDGEKREKKDGMSGPWNKQTNVKPAPVVTPVEPTPPPPPEDKTKPEKYVPPSLRGARPTQATKPSWRSKKTAPNLTSEEDFPTLGGMKEMGHGGDDARGNVQDPRHKKIELTLENKFAALQD